jgi:hypothetical protein
MQLLQTIQADSVHNLHTSANNSIPAQHKTGRSWEA